MINQIFEVCVALLVSIASRLGITYQAINVWIFVVLWPLLTSALIGHNVWQQNLIHQLRKAQRQQP